MYHFFKSLILPFVLLFYNPKTVGYKYKKIKGKAILISNHQSMWDPLMISYFLLRPVHWMGKSELFEKPITRFFFKAVKTFPVHRGKGDLSAIKHAFKILRDGKILGIFPQGTRRKNGEIGEFETGAAMIALRNKAPVIPIFVKGDYTKFKRMIVIAGQPINLSDHVGTGKGPETVAKATKLLEDKMRELSTAEY